MPDRTADVARLDAIDAALCERYGWRPLSATDKAAIRDSVAAWPAATSTARLRIARLLRGSRHWPVASG